MFLEDIPSRTKVFIDSNIFIYHFLGISKSCTDFLRRVEYEELAGYTSTIIIAEVLHRLMIAEIIEKYGTKSKEALRLLKEKPEIISPLTECEEAVRAIPRFNVSILTYTAEAIFQSRELRLKHLLLTNDSLNLQIMNFNDIINIATNDNDFKRIEHIAVWKPKDI